MIVKVQLSLWTAMDSAGHHDRMALIYDQERSFLVETLASSLPGLVDAMEGKQRAFFEAELDLKVDGRCVMNITTGEIVKHERDCSCRRTLKFKKMVADQDW